MSRRRGLTLVELMISAFLLGLLTTALFLIFNMGSKAWRKTDTQKELLQEAQVLSSRLSRQVQSSVYASLSVDGTALSFLTARQTDGTYALSSDGRPLWQAFVVYYLDAPRRMVLQREVKLVTPSTTAGLIESVATEAGTHPLSFYRTGGTPLARQVQAFNVAVYAPSVLNVSTEVRPGPSPQVEHVGMETLMRFRN